FCCVALKHRLSLLGRSSAHSYTFSSCFSLWPFALVSYLLCFWIFHCFLCFGLPLFCNKPSFSTSCNRVLSLTHWAKRWFPPSSISGSIPEKSPTAPYYLLFGRNPRLPIDI